MLYKQDKDGFDLVVFNEGIRYKYYKDSKGLGSIGIGHLILPTERYLISTTLSYGQVLALYNNDLVIREKWINTNCKWKDPITQYEGNAITSFLWQYHIDNPKYSNTRAAIISGNRESIIEHILQFVNIEAGSGKKELLPRRQRELSMFMTGSWR